MLAEIAQNGRYTEKALFMSKVIAKTMLSLEKKATMFFNFDTGIAYLIDEDGFHPYRIVYAGTPKVLEYKANNDEHYTKYGMTDPTKIYWNEPLKNSIVVPEKIACKYFAKENCKRFSVYKPAVKHPASDETLRKYYYEWKEKAKIQFIDDRERQKAISVIKKAIWSGGVDYNELTSLDTNYKIALEKVLEKPLTLASRSSAEESWIVACNGDTNKPESLFVIPQTYMNYAKQTGEILKTTKDKKIGVYFDAKTRVPSNVDCETAEKTLGQKLPTLNTPYDVPQDKEEEAKNYSENLRSKVEELLRNYRVITVNVQYNVNENSQENISGGSSGSSSGSSSGGSSGSVNFAPTNTTTGGTGDIGQ